MKFWLLASNNIYKNWMNSHIDWIMFTVSKLEIKSQNSGGTPCISTPSKTLELMYHMIFCSVFSIFAVTATAAADAAD